MQVYRTSLARCISSSQVRFNSADAAKSSGQRLAASWDDIHIPSWKEIKQAQNPGSLSSRLAARRHPPVSTPASLSPRTDVPSLPKSIPVVPRRNAPVSRKNASSKHVAKFAPSSSVKKPDVTLQSAADTLSDLFQVIPNESPSVIGSWEKGLETVKKSARSPSKARNVNGRSWTPGGNKVRSPVNPTSSTAQNASAGRRNADSSLQKKKDVNDKDNVAAAQSNVEDDEDAEIYLDYTVIDGVSLLAPRPDQPTQLWYESILQQNREPQGPRVIYPDIDIPSDLHNLFGVDRAQQQGIVVSQLSALKREPPEVRPAVKKGKVEYQVRKIMRRYGGDYSHLQPRLVPTDLRRKMRPSQLARLTMSRQTEASAEQRRTFDALISSTLKDVDIVEETIRV